MKSILMVLAAAFIALTSVSTEAADPANPTPPLPQPVVQDGRMASAGVVPPLQRGEARFYTPFELHMIQTYRMNVNADPNRVDSLQSPGDAGSGAGAGGDAAGGS